MEGVNNLDRFQFTLHVNKLCFLYLSAFVLPSTRLRFSFLLFTQYKIVQEKISVFGIWPLQLFRTLNLWFLFLFCTYPRCEFLAKSIYHEIQFYSNKHPSVYIQHERAWDCNLFLKLLNQGGKHVILVHSWWHFWICLTLKGALLLSNSF